jgi:hypothetical protein
MRCMADLPDDHPPWRVRYTHWFDSLNVVLKYIVTIAMLVFVLAIGVVLLVVLGLEDSGGM